MKCDLNRNELRRFLAGELSGAESSRIRHHLAGCPSCAATLSVVDRTELLPALDEVVEPSENLRTRFHATLREHHRRRQVPMQWWQKLMPVGLPGRVVLGGAVAALVIGGVLLRLQQPATPPPAPDVAIVENLQLYQDMAVIRDLDLLEDFDDINGMAEHEAASK
jgi:anti-sigma factor RsiW